MALILYRLLWDGFGVLPIAWIGLGRVVVLSTLGLWKGGSLLGSLLPRRCSVALRRVGASCTSSRLLYIKTRCRSINNQVPLVTIWLVFEYLWSHIVRGSYTSSC